MALNNAADTHDQAPLRGVVLCCTSLLADVRTKLAASAIEMGAIHKQDLTADVTHLIVGSIATPKYRYVAKHRPDIAVLRAEWVDAVKAVWMDGDDDADGALTEKLAALEQEYALPPFFGLQISITGFEDVEQRAQIEATVAAKGGLYSGDMTRATTHLIVADAKTPSAKYTHAKQWNILTVSYKWFEESIARGMALDEGLYAPELPLEQQGIGAFRPPMENPRSVLGKRGRGDAAANSKSGDAGGRRKLRKATSMRLEGHSQDLWQGLSVHEIQVETTELNAWEDESQTLRAAANDRRHEAQPTTSKASHPAPAPEDTGLFSGYYLLMHGFDARRMAKIRQYTEPNGATFVDSASALSHTSTQPNFRAAVLLVPHTHPPANLPTVPTGTLTATEFWIERCLHHKSLLDPRTDVLSRPIAPLSACAGLVVTSTGFAGPDLLHVAKAVAALGATYAQVLSPAASVLLCGGGGGGAGPPEAAAKKEKLYYAAKHRIPVVGAEWLWATLRNGRREPFAGFLVKVPAFDVAAMSGGGGGEARSGSVGLSPGSGSGSGSRGSEKQKSESTSFKRLSATRKRPMTPALAFEKVVVEPPARASAPAAAAAAAAGSHPVPSKATPPPTRSVGGKRAGGSRGPFILEDDDDDDDHDTCDMPMPADDDSTRSGRAEAISTTTVATKAKPLAEISPNVSQRSEHALSQQPSDQQKKQNPAKTPQQESIRTDQAESDSAVSNPVADPTPPTDQPPISGIADPLQALALLRAKQRDARCPSDGQPPPKRKNRLLGRNASWISNPSVERAASPALATEVQSFSQQDGAVGEANPTADGFSISRQTSVSESFGVGSAGAPAVPTAAQTVPPQGTQLAYEIEDSHASEAKRRALGRKLGCASFESGPDGDGIASREGEGVRRGVVRDSEVVAVLEARRERRSRAGRR